MIRSVLLAFGFLAVTVGLLFLSPSSSEDAGEELVTRAGTGLTGALPSGDADIAQRNDVSSVDLSTGAVSDQDQIDAMTRNIITALRSPQPAVSQASPMASSTPRPAALPAAQPVAVEADGVRQRLLRIHAEGGTLFELEDIVREAVAAKDITVDPAHFASSGQLDARALLASIVPELIVAPVTPPTQSFFYRIRPEDSLAGLALTFYGAPELHSRIMAANADTITSPQDIFPGKLIEVPSLTN